MKYFTLFLFSLIANACFAQCQDYTITVKGADNYPIKNATVIIEYSTSGSIESKKTNNNGVATFPCQDNKLTPHIMVSIIANGYSFLPKKEVWKGSLIREIIASKEDGQYAKVRTDISSSRKKVVAKIQEVQEELVRSSLSPSEINELEDLSKDLEQLRQEYDELLKESSSHEREASAYEALYDEKNIEYEELRKKFNLLKDKFDELEEAIAIELLDCKCEGWNSDYIKLSLRAKDGRNGLILTSTHEFAVDIRKEGKNTSDDEILLFDDYEDNTKHSFLFRPSENGYYIMFLRPRGNAFEREYKNLGDNPYNYVITFYNKELDKYRGKYKISLGSYKIKDLNDTCGKKKRLEAVP